MTNETIDVQAEIEAVHDVRVATDRLGRVVDAKPTSKALARLRADLIAAIDRYEQGIH